MIHAPKRSANLDLEHHRNRLLRLEDAAGTSTGGLARRVSGEHVHQPACEEQLAPRVSLDRVGVYRTPQLRTASPAASPGLVHAGGGGRVLGKAPHAQMARSSITLRWRVARWAALTRRPAPAANRSRSLRLRSRPRG